VDLAAAEETSAAVEAVASSKEKRQSRAATSMMSKLQTSLQRETESARSKDSSSSYPAQARAKDAGSRSAKLGTDSQLHKRPAKRKAQMLVLLLQQAKMQLTMQETNKQLKLLFSLFLFYFFISDF
jgi:hypothetical protein